MKYIVEFDNHGLVVVVFDDGSTKTFTTSEYAVIKDILPIFTDDSIKRFDKIHKKNK